MLGHSGTFITSIAGDIALTGATDGGAAANFRSGVEFEFGADIASTGTGANAADISITGTAGQASASGSTNFGVLLEDTGAGVSVSSVDGDITITGTGAQHQPVTETGSNNDGVFISAPVTATGDGAILIDGTATDGRGVKIAAAVTSSSGAVTLTGDGLDQHGIDLTQTVQTTGGGSVNLVSDTLNMTAPARSTLAPDWSTFVRVAATSRSTSAALTHSASSSASRT